MSSKPPETLTTDQCHQLLDALLCRAGTPKQQHRGIRNHTLALVMLDAGLRVGELVQLTRSSLWYNGQPVTSIFVPARIAHSTPERYVPLSARLSEAVSSMQLNLWSTFPGPDDHSAFYSIRPSRPLTTRQVERIISEAGVKAFGRPIKPHVLRHTFASHLMHITDMKTVQKLLGLKSQGSTQIYTGFDNKDLTAMIASLDRGDSQ